MVKQNLREQGFSVHDKSAPKSVINFLWIAFTVALVFGTVRLAMAIIGWFPLHKGGMHGFDTTSPIAVNLNPGAVPFYLLALIICIFLYLGLKFLFTFLFCSDRFHSVKLKILEGKGLPICHCREGLKTWQVVMSYAAPIIIVYVLMFILSLTMVSDPFREVEYGYLTMLLIMSFFFAWDLSLVTYVLALKIINKTDYIAINHHVYELTIYKKTYAMLGKLASRKRAEDVRQYRRTRLFTKMTTCANPECENYAKDLGQIAENCPLCGGRIYIAEVFENINSCINPECENYGHELKAETKVCSNCGMKTGKLAFKFRPDLTIPSVAVTLAVTLIFVVIRLLMREYNMNSAPIIVDLLRYLSFVGCIAMGWISKSRLAFFLSVGSFIFVALLGFIM